MRPTAHTFLIVISLIAGLSQSVSSSEIQVPEEERNTPTPSRRWGKGESVRGNDSSQPLILEEQFGGKFIGENINDVIEQEGEIKITPPLKTPMLDLDTARMTFELFCRVPTANPNEDDHRIEDQLTKYRISLRTAKQNTDSVKTLELINTILDWYAYGLVHGEESYKHDFNLLNFMAKARDIRAHLAMTRALAGGFLNPLLQSMAQDSLLPVLNWVRTAQDTLATQYVAFLHKYELEQKYKSKIIKEIAVRPTEDKDGLNVGEEQRTGSSRESQESYLERAGFYEKGSDTVKILRDTAKISLEILKIEGKRFPKGGINDAEYSALGSIKNLYELNLSDNELVRPEADPKSYLSSVGYAVASYVPLVGYNPYLYADALATSLAQLQKLRVLKLERTRLGEAGGVYRLTTAFSKLSRLEELDVQENGLQPADGVALGESFKYLTSLTTLNLENNNLGCEGLKGVCRGFLSPERYINVVALKSLNLKKNNIGLKGATTLAQALAYLLSLESLHLAENNITAVGVEQILIGLIAASPSLKSVSLSDGPFQTTSGIETQLEAKIKEAATKAALEIQRLRPDVVLEGITIKGMQDSYINFLGAGRNP